MTERDVEDLLRRPEEGVVEGLAGDLSDGDGAELGDQRKAHHADAEEARYGHEDPSHTQEADDGARASCRVIATISMAA